MGNARFSNDFKRDAVRQLTERGYPVSEVSQWLGVSQHSHYECRIDLNEQKRSGCMLGVNCPRRIVDHEIAARDARARLTDIRNTVGYSNEAKRVFVKHGSRKKRISRWERTPAKTNALAMKQLKLNL